MPRPTACFIHAPSAQKPKKNASPELWEEYREQQDAMKLSTVAAGQLRELPNRMPGKQIIISDMNGKPTQRRGKRSRANQKERLQHFEAGAAGAATAQGARYGIITMPQAPNMI
ncbi:MAG: hypothetical protein LBJ10_11710 [Clostridiales bacterium]|jgi:hypothetical protein|nr:hypothetical protein [Clostridiales bacterium]